MNMLKNASGCLINAYFHIMSTNPMWISTNGSLRESLTRFVLISKIFETVTTAQYITMN